MPFLSTAVSELLKLLGEADTFESKHRIDQSLNVLIERAEERVPAFNFPLLLTYHVTLRLFLSWP